MKLHAIPLPPVRHVASFLRPAGWRGKTPDPEDLAGALVFERERSTRSFDGTDIAYTVFGDNGPWIALVPGYCCPDNFWRYLVPALSGDYRVIVYDLRGLGRSGMPRPPGYRAHNISPHDFTIENQVRDLEAVLDAEKIAKCALVGHSMGGQIVLEAYRQCPERISALVMLTAPFESPLKTFYGRDFSNLFRLTRLWMTLLPRVSVLVWRSLFLANPRLTHQIGQLTRALGPRAKLDDMETYYRHMAYLDPLIMLMMAEAMRQHSAADVLEDIEIPALIIAGTLDTFTPISLAKAMRDLIPESELVVVEGSHAAVIETPDEINDAIASFFRRTLRTVTGKAQRATPPTAENAGGSEAVSIR